MITFHPWQSDHARCFRKKAYAGKLQIRVRNCAAKLHSHFHEARKIVCNNLSSAVQAHVMELLLYTKQALPLIFIRLSRLANSSPMNWRNPARRSRNGREPSHKKSGEMPRLLPRNFPAMAGQQRKQHCRISARAIREITRNTRATVSQRPRHNPSNKQCNIPRNILQADSPKFWHYVFNHDTQQL